MGSNRSLAIETINKDGFVLLTCNGNSMQPLMKPRDTLHIKKVDPSILRTGDAVFCRINGNLQVHKIGAIKNGNQFRIENNRGHINGWINSSKIYGICVQIENNIIISKQELEKRHAEM